MTNDTRQQAEQTPALEDQRRRWLEQSQPELKRGFEAFRQSYAAYEKMAEQFRPADLSTAAQASKPI
jgi:hypothetical protein